MQHESLFRAAPCCPLLLLGGRLDSSSCLVTKISVDRFTSIRTPDLVEERGTHSQHCLHWKPWNLSIFCLFYYTSCIWIIHVLSIYIYISEADCSHLIPCGVGRQCLCLQPHGDQCDTIMLFELYIEELNVITQSPANTKSITSTCLLNHSRSLPLLWII